MYYKRLNANNHNYIVVKMSDYVNDVSSYPISTTAIEIEDYILPLRNKTDEKTGISINSAYSKIKEACDGVA